MLDLLKDPKKAATFINGGDKPVSDKPQDEEKASENDYGVGIEAAGKKVLAAFEQKDVKKFVSEMKNFMHMCSMEELDEPSDESIEG